MTRPCSASTCVFVAEFLIGGVTGIFLGASATDIYLQDLYFVVAHFHYTFFPIAIIGVFAAITYWFPKMFGRMMNETLGKIHFWGTIIGFNVVFIPLFLTGAAGDHRRIYDYRLFAELATPGLQNLRVTATIGLLRMLAFQAFFLFNFVYSLFKGPVAEANPWKANTLEWLAPSPSPHGNLAQMVSEHVGLRVMHERAEEVGGSLKLFPEPDKGTTVEIRLPIIAH